jgi:hypothetical protein
VKRPDQHPQLPPDGALIRRMDAYLSGESTEATAIIKDARAALSSQPADIRRAQIEAGEAAVVASLSGTGLRWDAAPVAPVAAHRRPKRSADEMRGIAEIEDLAGGVFAAGALVAPVAAVPEVEPSDAQIDALAIAQWGPHHGAPLSAHRAFARAVLALTSPTPPVQPTSEALTIAVDALDEIALAGMSGSGQESEEGMHAWHARRAWEFIGIAARAKEAVKALTAAQAEGGSK